MTSASRKPEGGSLTIVSPDSSPCSTITSDHHRPRHRALQVSAHQSGSLITIGSSRRWPAGLWPAEIGAPRRSRTYNPLVARQVIDPPLANTLMLVRACASGYGSCAAMAADDSCLAVSDDQSGDFDHRPVAGHPDSHADVGADSHTVAVTDDGPRILTPRLTRRPRLAVMQRTALSSEPIRRTGRSSDQRSCRKTPGARRPAAPAR